MIIWKSQVCKRLKCVKELTNEVDKNAAAVVRTDSPYTVEVVGLVLQKSPWLYQMFSSLPHCTLDIFGINHGDEYGRQISANFPVYGPVKAIELAQKQNNKDRKKL